MKNAKKVVFCLMLLVLGALLLVGCECEHSWKNATCQTPATCRLCGETAGTVLQHNWQEATCTTPKTCKLCGKTTGNSLEHNWMGATCTVPKTCEDCGETTGNTLEHNWTEATCTVPKTCKDCGETTGNTLAHNWIEATCTMPETCLTCGQTSGNPKGHQWLTHSYSFPPTCTICEAMNGLSAYDKITDYLLKKGQYYSSASGRRYGITYEIEQGVVCGAYYFPDLQYIALSMEMLDHDAMVVLSFKEGGTPLIPWVFTMPVQGRSCEMYGVLNAYTYTKEEGLSSYSESNFPALSTADSLYVAEGCVTLICRFIGTLFEDIGITAYDMGFVNYK